HDHPENERDDDGNTTLLTQALAPVPCLPAFRFQIRRICNGTVTGIMSSAKDPPAGPFRSRYSAEESSDAAYEESLRTLRCMGRKRSAVAVLLSSAFVVVVWVVTRAYLFFVGMREARLDGDIQMISPDGSMRHDSGPLSTWGSFLRRDRPDKVFGRAKSESGGFFDAISNNQWEEMKREAKSIIDAQDSTIMTTSHLLSESGANIHSNTWWVDNWKINFSCPSKISIGGRWICDPKRVITIADEKLKVRWRRKRRRIKRECVAYVSGGMAMEFGNQFLDFSLARMIELHSGEVVWKDSIPCEVHIFTPDGGQEIPKSLRDGLHVHNWGFRPSIKLGSMGIAADNATTVAFKTLEETIVGLGHSGKVSILALDCESCEWDIYRDLVKLKEPIRQVLMQMHGTPYMANELFLAMQEAGYVIFQREKEIRGSGEVYDYSWLKLSPSFFNWQA
ncbi:hypothetical protein ACHAWF_012287, partial [Thalassiosira exigua]